MNPKPFSIHVLLILSILACNFSSTPATSATTQVPPPSSTTSAASPLAPVKSDVTLTLGAPLNDSPIKPLLGVNIGPIPSGAKGNPDVTAQYQQVGVTLIRTHDFYGPFDLATIYPDQNADPAKATSYSFAESDKVYEAIAKGGFELYLRVGNSYNNSNKPITNRDNTIKAMVEVVRHYDEASKKAGKPLRYVEVWNEPDNKQFWTQERTEFFDLFAGAVKAIKSAYPNLKVGGPGLAPLSCLASQGQNYTQSLLDYTQKNNVTLDFFSWHVYSNEPNDFVNCAKFYREQLDKRGYNKTESHITEWNTQFRDAAAPNAGGKNDPADPLARTGAKAAALTTAFWIALQQQKVEVSTYYRGTDPAMNAPTFYGLFYADGKPKPSGLAFGLWAQTAKHPTRLAVTTSGGNLWVLAGQDTNGGLAILIANPSDKDTSWQLTTTNKYTVTLQQIADAAQEIQTSNLVEPGAKISAWATQLALLKPAK